MRIVLYLKYTFAFLQTISYMDIRFGVLYPVFYLNDSSFNAFILHRNKLFLSLVFLSIRRIFLCVGELLSNGWRKQNSICLALLLHFARICANALLKGHRKYLSLYACLQLCAFNLVQNAKRQNALDL